MLPTQQSQGWDCIRGTFLLSGLFPELQFRHRNGGPDFSFPRCFCSLIAISFLPFCRAKQCRQSNGRSFTSLLQQQLPKAANATVLSWILVSSLLCIHGFVNALHWGNHHNFTCRLVSVSASDALGRLT